MHLPAKEHQGLPAATSSSEEGIEWILPQRFQEEPTL